MSDTKTPNKILILFAHPALNKSKINIELVEEVKNLEGVTFHDLYKEYPDFLINVKKEQELLLDHDIIVFQHPFYWYSSPAIVKEWEDLVLQYGFAIGKGGTALQGKSMMTAISLGGSFNSYRPEGINKYTLLEFLKPFEQSAVLCGMRYLPPFVVHSAPKLNKHEEVAEYKNLYGKIIKSLRDGDLDPRELEGFDYINDYFVE